MPWDASELWQVALDAEDDGPVVEQHLVAGLDDLADAWVIDEDGRLVAAAVGVNGGEHGAELVVRVATRPAAAGRPARQVGHRQRPRRPRRGCARCAPGVRQGRRGRQVRQVRQGRQVIRILYLSSLFGFANLAHGGGLGREPCL